MLAYKASLDSRISATKYKSHGKGKAAGRVLCSLPARSGLLLHRDTLGFLQGLDELLAVSEELGDALVKISCDLIDRNEEGDLAMAKGIEDLPIIPGDPEDALPIRDELDFGEMLLETGLLPKVVVGSPDSLQRHSPVQQGLDDPEGHEVPKRVQPANAGPASGLLNARTEKADLVPIPQLMAGTTRKTTCLKYSKPLQSGPFRS